MTRRRVTLALACLLALALAVGLWRDGRDTGEDLHTFVRCVGKRCTVIPTYAPERP